jgi:hypothetical protein
MLNLGRGLKNSLIVMELLRDDDDLRDVYVSVGAFTNCREVGLTFAAPNTLGNFFTWCIYEHRNSDQIIVNGRPGLVSWNGVLPYKADDKYDVIKSFGWGQFQDAADFLKREILEWSKKSYKIS